MLIYSFYYKGTFYAQELQKINVNLKDAFKIEKIVKTRKRGGNKEYFVKWKYWPDKFNSWVPEADVKSL